MKLILIILLSLPYLDHPNINKIRTIYQQAAQSKEATFQLLEDLKYITKKSDSVLLAYKGAAMTLKAKYARGKEQKKQYFREGVGLIEHAIKQRPANIEIRFIRLSVQENTPRFLKYKSNISKDKTFILTHFKAVRSAALKEYIRRYALQSGLFSKEEKESL